MSFSERFNEWLIAKGKEPVDPEMAKILDLAARDTLEDLREHKEEIVAATQFFAAGLVEAIKKSKKRGEQNE